MAEYYNHFLILIFFLELKTIEDVKQFVDHDEHSIVGQFCSMLLYAV